MYQNKCKYKNWKKRSRHQKKIRINIYIKTLKGNNYDQPSFYSRKLFTLLFISSLVDLFKILKLFSNINKSINNKLFIYLTANSISQKFPIYLVSIEQKGDSKSLILYRLKDRVQQIVMQKKLLRTLLLQQQSFKANHWCFKRHGNKESNTISTHPKSQKEEDLEENEEVSQSFIKNHVVSLSVDDSVICRYCFLAMLIA